jgi:hypothetical protein
MSTPSSGLQVPGPPTEPFGSGKVKPPELGAALGANVCPELPEPAGAEL